MVMPREQVTNFKYVRPVSDVWSMGATFYNMVTGKIEIRFCNWKPLLFTAILLASKFWEDINFWNIDYVEALDLYPLKSINRMESEFISLCDYNIYVSAKLYASYQMQIRQLSNPVVMPSMVPHSQRIGPRASGMPT